jgi:hypothetical protein
MKGRKMTTITDTGTGYNPHIYSGTDGLWVWEIRGDVLTEVVATSERKRFQTKADAAAACMRVIADFKAGA